MAIANSLRFTRHAWAMPQVPGFPSGVWTASGAEEGDASGGDQTFQHIFRNQSNNLGDTNLYNIEQVSISAQGTGHTGARLLINGMDPGTGTISFPRPVDRAWAYVLEPMDTAAGIFTGVTPREGTVPIWVGTYDGVDTDLGDMIIAVDNVDSEITFVAVYGYFWAPGAVNAVNGIQRPANGLWRG